MRVLLGVVVVLVALWVLVKLVFGVVGAVFHLLLVAAVVVGLFALIKAGASRRIRASVGAREGSGMLQQVLLFPDASGSCY